MMLQLRWYQEEAKEALYGWMRTRSDNPCVVLPTAAGKTPLIASVCADAVLKWNSRVLILTHVKELLEQSAEKLSLMCPEIKYGVYSAGLKRRDKDNPVIIAGIQSVFRRACELGAFDLILIDECHLIPAEGDGMYRQFIAETKVVNPNVRIVGLTATPYRLKTGNLCGPNEILNGICYEVSVKRLMDEGFLSPMVGKNGAVKIDLARLPTLAGEFMGREMEEAFNVDAVVEAACKEICSYTMDRKGLLIFTSGVEHGLHVTATMARLTQETVEFVCGETSPLDRLRIVGGFKAQEYRILVNVNVLTTGFDAPHIDAVALLRATLSPGLYYQMAGRGFRLAPQKRNCLLLDFGGNIMRHGPVDAIIPPDKACGGEAPVKECFECHSVVPAAAKTCPDCGYVFPFAEEPPKPRHESTSTDADPVSSPKAKTEIWLDIQDVHYALHKKKGSPPDAPRTLRVDYQLNLVDRVSEWICLEHEGYVRARAIAWWVSRSLDRRMGAPATVEEALAIANSGGLAFPRRILVQETEGERFPRVIEAELEWPDNQGMGEEVEETVPPSIQQDDSDIPF
jgi:DNA repair protein RadD